MLKGRNFQSFVCLFTGFNFHWFLLSKEGSTNDVDLWHFEADLVILVIAFQFYADSEPYLTEAVCE